MTGGIEVKMGKLMEKVDNYRPDSAAEIISMQKALKQALLKKNIKEHPALKQMLDTLKKREEAYSLILSNKDDIEDVKRRSYFARRDEVRFILSFFEVDKTLESIERSLDYQLGDEVAAVDSQ